MIRVVPYGVGKPWVIDDELWELIEPLLPAWPARSPGPRPVPDRLCLQGILFVLHTGIGWEDLPLELGFGSGMTCWRRLRRWTDAGVFDRLHRLLLAELNAAGRIDWSRAVIDGGHIDAKKGGEGTGPSPVNRGKPGSKHHLITDGVGTPLAVITTGGNVPDISRAVELLDAVPPAGRPAGPTPPAVPGPARRQGLRQRRVPERLPAAADRADHPATRTQAHQGPGQAALRRGTGHRPTPPVPPPGHPMGTTPRPTPGTRQPRLRTHLLATPHQTDHNKIVLGALKACLSWWFWSSVGS